MLNYDNAPKQCLVRSQMESNTNYFKIVFKTTKKSLCAVVQPEHSYGDARLRGQESTKNRVHQTIFSCLGTYYIYCLITYMETVLMTVLLHLSLSRPRV